MAQATNSNVMNVMTHNINYEVYVGESRYLGTASVDLPEINYMTNEIKGAGIAGQIDMPTLSHIENLEVTLHWRTISNKPLNLFTQDSVLLTLYGAMQKYDAGKTGKIGVMAVKITLRGLSVGNTLGKLEPAEQTDTETKMHCDYIQIEIDGVKKFEHDKFNYVHYVGEANFLEGVKKALGLK